jgi:hypothetical protein
MKDNHRAANRVIFSIDLHKENAAQDRNEPETISQLKFLSNYQVRKSFDNQVLQYCYVGIKLQVTPLLCPVAIGNALHPLRSDAEVD